MTVELESLGVVDSFIHSNSLLPGLSLLRPSSVPTQRLPSTVSENALMESLDSFRSAVSNRGNKVRDPEASPKKDPIQYDPSLDWNTL